MIQTLKKYWFVCVIGAMLLAFVIYFAYDQNKDKLPGKTANGEDVVFTINKQDVTANGFYDSLFKDMGVYGLYQFMEKAVVDPTIETTDEMKEAAKQQADSVISQYKSTYGDQYKEMLLTALQGVGYSSDTDLEPYFIHMAKVQQLIKNYIEAKSDELIPSYVAEKSPRSVSHILVKMADPANPTAEEQQRVDAIKEALASGQDFGEVAKNLSEDSGSAVQNGSIGYMDADTQLVSPFLETALAMQEGTVSEWIQTTYGWHIIKCDTTNIDTLKTDDAFFAALATYYPNLQPEAVWEKAQSMNLDFKGNDELKAKLLTFMGISESTTPETTPTATPEATPEASAQPTASPAA